MAWSVARINGAVLTSCSGVSCRIQRPETGFILNRRVFDRELASFAARAGVDIITGEGVAGVEFSGKSSEIRCVITNRNNRFYGRMFLAADGINSPTARYSGLDTKISPLYMNVCAQVLAARIKVEPDLLIFHFNNKLAPGGYAWVFPKGECMANIGLGICPGISRVNPWKLLTQFLASYYPGCKILERISGICPTGSRLKNLVSGNLMVAGDAARMTNPLTGEGIVPAILSGILAAQACVKYLNSGNIEDLDTYRHEWDKRLGRKHNFLLRIRNGLIRCSDQEIEKLLLLIDDYARQIVFDKFNFLTLAMRLIKEEPRIIWHVRQLIRKRHL
jgi:digeranylgeranylglycerophospholipid reductase